MGTPWANRQGSKLRIGLMLSVVAGLYGPSAHAGRNVAEVAPELGVIEWGRDLDAAFAHSARDGKPVLILFDEVPGCSTVLGFGESVLAKATVKARVERDFHPVLVYNNRGGADRAQLKRYGEPAWNNPVVRIFDAQRRELAPRFAGPYTLAAFGRTLDAVQRASPSGASSAVTDEAVAYFGMYCFWTGEGKIGGINGVLATRPGFLDGEVVEVRYDAQTLSYADLLRAVKKSGAAERVFTRDAGERATAKMLFSDVRAQRGRFRYSAKDDKYQLRHRGVELKGIDPTAAMRANAAAYRGEDPAPYLR